MTEQVKKPYPGTMEAQDAGCTCPVIDNHYGRGWHGIEGTFCINGGCSVHDTGVLDDVTDKK